MSAQFHNDLVLTEGEPLTGTVTRNGQQYYKFQARQDLASVLLCRSCLVDLAVALSACFVCWLLLLWRAMMSHLSRSSEHNLTTNT